MSDPFPKDKIGTVAPPPEPKPKERTAEFIARSIPDDTEAAKKRLAAAKARRTKRRKATKHFGSSLPAGYVDAFDMLCERYDAPKAQVIKRILEDAFRAYCDDEELQIAGIPRVRPPNPFQPLQETVEHPQYEHWTPSHNGEAHYDQHEVAPPKLPPGTIMFTGAEVPDNPEEYKA